MNTVSKHITYNEATISSTAKKLGISNIPNTAQLTNMVKLANSVFEPVREYFNVPIYISSFFRSEALNKAIKGAKNSQHLCNKGAAIDVDADRYKGITNKDIFNYIFNNLDFDQLIWEYGNELNPDWVHVSYNEGNNRKQVLVAQRDDKGKTKYKKIR